MKLTNGAEQLGAYLLRLVEEQGSGGVADLPMPKSALASRLGMSAEMLSRQLARLRAEGLSVRRRRLVVRDREGSRRSPVR